MKCPPAGIWRPRYGAPGALPEYVEDAEIGACPVAFITPLSRWLLGELASAGFVSFGMNGPVNHPACFYGTNSLLWPAWWFDAFMVLTHSRNEADALLMKK